MKFLLRASVRLQLSLIFIFLCTFLILFVAYYSFTQTMKNEKNVFLENSLEQAYLLADFNVQALAFFDYDGAKENLDKLRRNKNIDKVILYDSSNNLFASYNPNNSVTDIKSFSFEPYFKTEQNHSWIDFGILTIIVPVEYKNQQYGYLYLEKNTKYITKIINDIMQDIIEFVIFSLILIFLFLVKFSSILV